MIKPPTKTLQFPVVIFDLDGTLIAHNEPIWKTFHTRLGSDLERRREVMRRVAGKEITYAEWFAEDVEMLREAGARREDFVAVLRTLAPEPGCYEIVETLRSAGAIVIVMSGGLDLALEIVLPGLVFDHIYINRIIFDTAGEIVAGVPTPFDVGGKAAGLDEVVALTGVPRERICFVGDGPNDVEIATRAGFSVAWGNAAPALVDVANLHLPGPDLRALLPYLGLD